MSTNRPPNRFQALPRVALLFVSVATAALLVLLSAGRGTGKPGVEVTISGVPEYIYLGHLVEVDIDYRNLGDQPTGPLWLSIEIPESFAVETAGRPYADTGRSLRWRLDALKPGERGSVAITLRGSAPADTSGADYGYEGYEGYAAFEEGFQMAARVTSADGVPLAEALAVADTGGVNEIDLSWLVRGSGSATWVLQRQGYGTVGSGPVNFGKRRFFTDDSVPGSPSCDDRYHYRLRILTQGRIIQTQYIEAEPTYCIPVVN